MKKANYLVTCGLTAFFAAAGAAACPAEETP